MHPFKSLRWNVYGDGGQMMNNTICLFLIFIHSDICFLCHRSLLLMPETQKAIFLYLPPQVPSLLLLIPFLQLKENLYELFPFLPMTSHYLIWAVRNSSHHHRRSVPTTYRTNKLWTHFSSVYCANPTHAGYIIVQNATWMKKNGLNIPSLNEYWINGLYEPNQWSFLLS